MPLLLSHRGHSPSIGPTAHLSGCTFDEGAFIATGATVFNGAHVGSGAEVRVGAVVQVGASLDRNSVVPMGWIAVGNPARILPTGDQDRIWAVQRTMDFAGRVWGVDRSTSTATTTRRYARSLVWHHANDGIENPRHDPDP